MPDFEITAPDGRRFVVTAPEGASDQDILAYAQRNMPQPSTMENAAHRDLLAAQGMNRQVGGAIGGIPDLAMAGARALGLPATRPGFFSDNVTGALDAGARAFYGASQPAQERPGDTLDKVAQGAGQGAGAAVSTLGAASALSKAPGLAGRVGQFFAAQPGLQAASGAVGGATSEATGNPWLGAGAALATAMTPGIFGRIVAPVRPSDNPEVNRLLGVARQEGLTQHMTPGQMANSEPLRRFENAQRMIPLNGVTPRNEGLQSAFNRSVLARAGIQGDVASPDVLLAQEQAVGQRIGDVMARNNLNVNALDPVGQQNIAALAQPVREAQQFAVGSNAQDVLKQYGNLLDKVQAGGVVEGTAVRELRTRLKEIADGVEGSNGDLARYLRDMRKALTDAMDRSMVATDAAEWKEANRLYANLMTIRDAMGSGKAAAEGNVAPSQLAASLKRNLNDGGYATGAGDLNDIARIGKVFVEKGISDSGTAQNQLTTRIATGGALAGVSGGLAALDPLAGTLAGLVPTVPTAAYRAGMATGYLNPRLPPSMLQADVSPDLLAAVLAARGKAALTERTPANGREGDAAAAAALLTR